MIRLRRIDHVCLRRRGRGRRDAALRAAVRADGARPVGRPRDAGLRLRAVLARARPHRRRRRARLRALRVGAAEGRLARRRPRAPARAGRRLRRARTARSSLHDPEGFEHHLYPYRDDDDRRPAIARQTTSLPGLRPRKLGHINRLTGDMAAATAFYVDVLGMEVVRLARRGRHLVPLQSRAPPDGARRHRHAALPPHRVRLLRLRHAARACSTTSRSTAAGCRGARCGTASPRTSAATCASPRSRCTSSATSTWRSSSPITSPASGRTTGSAPTPGGRCRPAPTSASTPRQSSPNRESRETRGIPLPPLQEV